MGLSSLVIWWRWIHLIHIVWWIHWGVRIGCWSWWIIHPRLQWLSCIVSFFCHYAKDIRCNWKWGIDIRKHRELYTHEFMFLWMEKICQLIVHLPYLRYCVDIEASKGFKIFVDTSSSILISKILNNVRSFDCVLLDFKYQTLNVLICLHKLSFAIDKNWLIGKLRCYVPRTR